MTVTVETMKNITLEDLIALGEFDCACGKKHAPGVARVIIEKGAVKSLPALLEEIGAKKPFLLSGHDSFAAAGEAVCSVLEEAGFPYTKYVFPVSPVRPTEYTVGSALMHFDYSCDAIIGIGSGVINDTGKMLARATGMKYIIVATAPSMDGFVSGTSSMDRDGLKTSIYSTAAWGVIGDLDILCNAPMHLLRAGVGDMLAKITSLMEWKLAKIIVGEDYCEATALLVERALNQVMDQSKKLLERDPNAVRAVMEGLLIAGIGMNFAGVSRPASGMEHYFSHIWDMRALAFEDAKFEQHGIQAGLGTLYTLMAYEAFLNGNYRPEWERAEQFVESFSLADWNRQLLAFIGPGAEAMIEGENREHKYDLEKHKARFAVIEENWDAILETIRTLPPAAEIKALMESIGFPTSASVIGYTNEQVKTTFTMTKDIRDKYVGTRLFWDLGILQEITEEAFQM
ncbi:MAG: sn-glycerol-1-phosphate dehydrogenase [Oscillospiraceae bacterium]|nr:sn-glycerol-1-phosphate dehydrogenase [Oscillospiraceae bacterium]